MLFTKRERLPPLVRHALAASGLGLMLGYLGPFGSNPALEFAERYLFWIGLTGTGYLLGLAVWRALLGSSKWCSLAPVMRVAVAAFLSALPQTFIAGWALSQANPGRIIAIGQLPLLFFSVLTIQLILLAAIFLIERSLADAPSADLNETPFASAMGKLAASNPDLIALEAQDHYVRVHTARGATLVLHRLSDAIADVTGVDGLRVHRGWWVASGAVLGTHVDTGRRWLLLSNGMRVPVSRNHLAAVRSRNWPGVGKDHASA